MRHKLKIGFLVILSLAFLNFSAYAEDAKSKDNVIDSGKKVKMNFTMKSSGITLETTEGKKPFEFVFGKTPMIPGVEEAIKGLKAGDKKKLSLKPEKGFGEINPKAIVEFPKSQFKEKNVKAGMMFNGRSKEGVPLRGTVKEVKKDTVILDFNHPLAGKNLDMDLEIMEVA